MPTGDAHQRRLSKRAMERELAKQLSESKDTSGSRMGTESAPSPISMGSIDHNQKRWYLDPSTWLAIFLFILAFLVSHLTGNSYAVACFISLGIMVLIMRLLITSWMRLHLRAAWRVILGSILCLLTLLISLPEARTYEIRHSPFPYAFFVFPMEGPPENQGLGLVITNPTYEVSNNIAIVVMDVTHRNQPRTWYGHLPAAYPRRNPIRDPIPVLMFTNIKVPFETCVYQVRMQTQEDSFTELISVRTNPYFQDTQLTRDSDSSIQMPEGPPPFDVYGGWLGLGFTGPEESNWFFELLVPVANRLDTYRWRIAMKIFRY